MTYGAECRRALVISPAFFGYESDIVAEFERQGYRTIFLDERPSNSAIIRAVLRARKSLVTRQIAKYYRSKWKEMAGLEFDIVLIVKAEVVPRWFVEDLRKKNPKARFVFYNWDAVSNVKNCLDVLDCFDELLSFDSGDVASRSDFTYLPLFYTRDFVPLASNLPRRHRLSFVGTLHTERYAFVSELFENRSQTFAFFYVQARWYFAVVKYLTREHHFVPWKDVSFQKISRQAVAEVFRNSVAVLDMPRRGQSGLTIRTFEVLASGSVLVTTNEAITSEPFYDPARIVVIPSDLNESEASRILHELDSLTPPSGPPDLFDRYSIESWVRAVATGRVDREVTE